MLIDYAILNVMGQVLEHAPPISPGYSTSAQTLASSSLSMLTWSPLESLDASVSTARQVSTIVINKVP